MGEVRLLPHLNIAEFSDPNYFTAVGKKMSFIEMENAIVMLAQFLFLNFYFYRDRDHTIRYMVLWPQRVRRRLRLSDRWGAAHRGV